MRSLFSILIIFSISSIKCQKNHIDDFSDSYSAIITQNKENKETYILKIIDNQTKNVEITETVHLDEYDFKDTKSNIKELPYGHQSIIIYDDFNFDEKKDIAIKYGNESCYGGPSYQVYLFNNQKFKYSSEFSDLAQNYCGFFEVDQEKKQIHTMTKSTCCWHQYSDFIIKNGKPFLIYQLEEQSEPYFITNSIKKWNGSQYIFYSEKKMDEDEYKNAIFRFQADNGKYVVLNVSENSKLQYYFLNKNKQIELFQSDIFFYSKSNNSISFETDSASYIIYNNRIEVTYDSKTSTIKADVKTRRNNISDFYAIFKESGIENLEVVD